MSKPEFDYYNIALDFIDNFYNNGYNPEIVYMGMYGTHDNETDRVTFTTYHGRQYINNLLPYLIDGTVKNIMTCLSDGETLKILLALINQTMVYNDCITIERLSDICNIESDRVLYYIKKLVELDIVISKNYENTNVYGAKKSLVAGYFLMLTGIWNMTQPGIPDNAYEGKSRIIK